MTNTNIFQGFCQCGKIKYVVNFLPKEIADCYCTICKNIHKTQFVSFAKYGIRDIKFMSNYNFKIISSSNRAIRCACNDCNDIVFMYYNNSENLWLVTNTFKFDITCIEHYDICK